MAKVLVNKPENWEQVNDENDDEVTHRLKVFGGWLVITKIFWNNDCSISQSFIPDPKHKWEI